MTRYPVAIVLGLENAIGLTVVRELGAHGVPVHGVAHDARAIGLASRYCRSGSVRPAGPVAQWLPALIARTGAGAVLAISEADLIALSALPSRIGDCHILTPRAGPLGKVVDKLRTLEAAAAVGLLAPQTWQPRAGDDVAARMADLPYPLVAKWANPPEILPILDRAGIAWVKADYIRTPQDLRALLDRYAPIGRWPLIQQYCRGVGLGQMLYMQDGRATLRFQHRRLHEWPPEGGVSTCCRAEPADAHHAQMALSEALLRAIGWDGPAMVEYRYEPDSGRYWLMEVNGRFWGSLPLARYCGAHFAWEAYRRTVLGQGDPAPAPRDDLRARYMVPETKRLARILFAPGRIGDPFFRRRPLADLASYLAGFLDPRVRYFVFSPSDPRPWLRDMAQIVRKAVRRGKR
ncbi:carboxylate--amine ligase [Sphingobium sp. HBC34]|uniref:Carboxylate--amine ligase n=1 Tax=Sphingobium cyanobacteriorum TaxID=3063954 RepID=A0ABT8ZNT4_9SPHN|nr:carboxylate--amine ligase [Sphingobium sp. HBC34]MDO7835778.1 carboxylate--amine ligase [Sphingobium sp. HBC34]